MWLQRFRDNFQSMRTLQSLLTGAEDHARAQGQSAAGAEHFLLAALDLPDGSARRAFARVGADPAAIPAAIERQYLDALHGVGLDAPLPGAAALTAAPSRMYQAQASGRELMQALAASRKGTHGPLRGAHVVALVAGMPLGVAARTLRAMQVDTVKLGDAARAEVQAPG